MTGDNSRMPEAAETPAAAAIPPHKAQLIQAEKDHRKAAHDLKEQCKADGVDRSQSINEHLANAAKCAAQLK